MNSPSPLSPMRLGFLYPGHAAEDDYEWLAEEVGGGITAEIVHTSVGTDAHRVGDLLDLGSRDRLTAGALELRDREVSVAVWACTSGSFVFGPEGARDQVRWVADATGVPASSTSFAFVHALDALSATRVAIAATYPTDVARAFVAFLEAFEIESRQVTSHEILTAEEVGTFDKSRALSLVQSVNREDVDVVLVPDTALHSVRWVEEMEAVTGRTVLTANQVTLWEARRLAGTTDPAEGVGTLFRQAKTDIRDRRDG